MSISVPVANVGSSTGGLTDLSGTLTLGASAQQIQAETKGRRYFLFQNISANTMFLNFGVTAVQDTPSIKVTAGSTFLMENSFISGDLISLIGVTTGDKFVCKVG